MRVELMRFILHVLVSIAILLWLIDRILSRQERRKYYSDRRGWKYPYVGLLNYHRAVKAYTQPTQDYAPGMFNEGPFVIEQDQTEDNMVVIAQHRIITEEENKTRLVPPVITRTGNTDNPVLPPDDGTNQSNEPNKFYAEAEVLKQASGYYTFMNFLPLNPNTWVENCHPCQRPMHALMFQPGTKLRALISTAIDSYAANQTLVKKLRDDPSALNPSAEFYMCPTCQDGNVWTKQLGFWVKVEVEGEKQLVMDKIKGTESKLLEAKVMELNALPDPGTPPSPDSTICPHCHVYRTVSKWEPVPGEDSGKNIHTCPKCNTGDIVDRPISTEGN